MKELNWRLLLLGGLLCAVAAAATPYVTLKLGQSVDLTMGGMFLAAFVLGKRMQGQELAVELNIIQTMIGLVSSIAFMVVILAAFYYIQNVFGRNIGFNLTTWQMFLWLFVSANLGVFMGIFPRGSILRDHSIPWPGSKATLSVAQTLTDPKANVTSKRRRDLLLVSTGIAGFLTFLRDGLGVITSIVANPALNIALGPEFAAFGLGMLVPLSVGLSGLLGTWLVSAFGELVGKYSALSGVAQENFGNCLNTLNSVGGLDGAKKAQAMDFLNTTCGKAGEFVGASSHFKYVVQWMMWPATAMMIAAALTSVIIPIVLHFMHRDKVKFEKHELKSLADENIPLWWTTTGIAVSVTLLVWMTSTWFAMPWEEVLLAVAIQPLLIVAGLRVLGITGSGPVSLMANATQFLFGLIWPAQIRSNLTAAYVSANPQATSENVVPSFWVAQRLGGKFKTLILAQLIVIPIGAILTPIMFNMLERTYGIGLNPGQLAAPTGLKIATLAIVMEKGLSFLPHGALQASVIAIFIGVFFELLLAFKKTNKQGHEVSRFWFVPIPAALGFALILPASLNIGMAIGSVISAVWHQFSPEEGGGFDLYATPLASGLVAGEAMVGSILLPALATVMEFVKH
ncbi:MAG: OPT/YSL family transporter [Elusimicrobia bacterium]|nr:OPT/YSL family transporter [Elusimicrobiota bacterium]